MKKGNDTIIVDNICIATMLNGEKVYYDIQFYDFFKDKNLFVSSVVISSRGRKACYICFYHGGIKWRLHRYVIGAREGEIVDHKDRDTFNNRLENLRIVTHIENLYNRGHYKNNSSGFRGVYKNGNKYRSFARIDKVDHTIGNFDDKITAARAYDAFVTEKLGEKATTNVFLGFLPPLLSSRENKKP